MLQRLIAVILLIFTPIAFALGPIGPDPNGQGFAPAVALPTTPAMVPMDTDYADAITTTVALPLMQSDQGGDYVTKQKTEGLGGDLLPILIACYLWDTDSCSPRFSGMIATSDNGTGTNLGTPASSRAEQGSNTS